jgi:hypothetical protein
LNSTPSDASCTFGAEFIGKDRTNPLDSPYLGVFFLILHRNPSKTALATSDYLASRFVGRSAQLVLTAYVCRYLLGSAARISLRYYLIGRLVAVCASPFVWMRSSLRILVRYGCIGLVGGDVSALRSARMVGRSRRGEGRSEKPCWLFLRDRVLRVW